MTQVVAGWLLDTNVVSSRSTFSGNPQVAGWLDAYGPDLWTSVITVAEIGRGLELKEMALERLRGEVLRRETARLEDMKAWAAELGRMFAGRTVPIDAEIASEWARVAARFPWIRDGDKILGATAAVRNLGIATRNVGHFAHLAGKGIVIANPFEGTQPGDGPDPVALLLRKRP